MKGAGGEYFIFVSTVLPSGGGLCDDVCREQAISGRCGDDSIRANTTRDGKLSAFHYITRDHYMPEYQPMG